MIYILGIPFHSLTMDDLLSTIEKKISAGDKTKLSFSNPEFVISAKYSPFLKGYLNSTDFNLADGFGIILAAGLQGRRLPERVTGTDFTQRMAALSAQTGYRIYLLGGKHGVAEEAAKKLKLNHPGCVIVGTHHGYFDVHNEQEIVSSINSVHPDFLMVCLGNPRQEEWIHRNFDQLKAKVIFGNGGALDFASGKVTRAPYFMQKTGFEWLWRFFQDFSLTRLRRLSRLPVFMIFAVADAIKFRLKSRKDKLDL